MLYLPNDILVKVDRASMSHSLEVRVPFLDPAIAAFAWRLPLSMKIAQGRGKRLVRRVLARYVPPALTDRPKSGFEIPLAEWLRTDLRDWAESLLNEERLRRAGYFHVPTLRATWHEHVSGRHDHAHRLWCVLMFEAWMDSRSTSP
jgi:asparagine synthase (glutamine-hydrolysing)